MYLRTLKLRNFRCFSELNIDFPERLAVIVGDNGAGKTAILEAAAIAVGTFSHAMDKLTNFSIEKTDAYYKCYDMGSVVDVQAQFPVEICAEASVNNHYIYWERFLNSAKARGNGLTRAKELVMLADEYQDRLRNGDKQLVLPVIAYYGTGRLWEQKQERKTDSFEKNSRSNGYLESLDGAANDKLIRKWFQKMTILQYQQNDFIPEYTAVCRAIAKCLSSVTNSDDTKVQYNLDTNEIDVIYTNTQGERIRTPINRLSDGYRCTLSLIADIAYRMAVLNPQLLGDVLEETPGVVLIDEIDLHLHPLWQQKILKDLMTIFPKVQFIVSTHAPAVINSVPSESLIMLKDKQVYRASNETYGKDANTIFREVMDAPERPPEIKDRFEQFYGYLDELNYKKAGEVLEHLEAILGSNDTELVGCRVRLELEQM